MPHLAPVDKLLDLFKLIDESKPKTAPAKPAAKKPATKKAAK